MLEFIVPALQNLLTIENLIWINLGVFIGSVFAAIPGLTVILCIILFLPFTYQMTAIPGMMFLLGIYCAGGYGGSVSAILINTPGTPHAAATMLDGYPLNQKGRTKAALKIALYASTFGGIFSALMLLFLAPQVAKVAAMLGTAEYFLVCLFGLTIIAGISGDSLSKGVMAACIGLLVSCIGADPMTSRARLTFGVERLYLGLDLAICLIGLFALVQVMTKAERKEDRLILDTSKIGDGLDITKEEKKRMVRPMLVSSIIGTIIGIIRAPAHPWPRGSHRRSIQASMAKGSVEALPQRNPPTMPSPADADADLGIQATVAWLHHTAKLRDDQRPQSGAVFTEQGDHVIILGHSGQPHSCPNAFRQGRLRSAGDFDPDHRHVLLCGRVLRQQELL